MSCAHCPTPSLSAGQGGCLSCNLAARDMQTGGETLFLWRTSCFTIRVVLAKSPESLSLLISMPGRQGRVVASAARERLTNGHFAQNQAHSSCCLREPARPRRTRSLGISENRRADNRALGTSSLHPVFLPNGLSGGEDRITQKQVIPQLWSPL